MNIWLIQTGEPLPLSKNVRKMRTAFLAEKLIERGHSVVWFTSAFDHFKKEWVFKEDTELALKDTFKIKAIKGTGYKKNFSFSRLIDHRIIAKKFKKMALQRPKPDIIIASMPPHDLAYESVAFAKKNKIPVLVDIRDPWPDLFLDYMTKKLRKLIKILLYKDFKMVKKTMQMADGLIAVTDTFLEWGLRYANREKRLQDKVFYLGSKKPTVQNDVVVSEKFNKLREFFGNKFIVIFIGTISKSYHNPFILLKAAEKLKDIHFIIAGDGELFEALKQESQPFANVTLTGWINQAEIEFLLRNSKIGICPITKIVNLPTNKVYTYLSAGLPVISAFDGDLKEIIKKYQIGFYYPPNDVEALTTCIKRLYENAALYKKISTNAKRVFDDMFDADKIYKGFAEHMEWVIDDYRQKRN